MLNVAFLGFAILSARVAPFLWETELRSAKESIEQISTESFPDQVRAGAAKGHIDAANTIFHGAFAELRKNEALILLVLATNILSWGGIAFQKSSRNRNENGA